VGAIMVTMLHAVWVWLWTLWPWSRWKVAYVEDAPDVPRIVRVYIVGGRKHPFQAMMACPCGCSSPIWLDLVPGSGEHWTARADARGIATLAPSVWRTDDCCSHFVLKGGRVRWC
jgi:hypothetical protein